MPLSGGEELHRWREAGAWWAGERPLEIHRKRLSSGKIRDEIKRLESPWAIWEGSGAYVENNTEELALRPRKVRDEKVSYAMGMVPERSKVQLASSSRPYAALHCLSGYSFGRSLLFAEELPRRAAQLGIPAIAITDVLALTGAVELVREAKKAGVKPLVGATIELEEGGEIVLIARSKVGYQQLSLLITACHLGEPRLFPLATWSRLEQFNRDLICLTAGDRGRLNRLAAAREFSQCEAFLRRLMHTYGRNQVFVEIERSFLPWEYDVNRRLAELAEKCRLPMVAGGLVTHGRPHDFPAQDVLVCSETLCAVDEVMGRKPHRAPEQQPVRAYPMRSLNGERFLRSPCEMAELFADQPSLLDQSLMVAEMCDDNVLPERTQLPRLFSEPDEALRARVMDGARRLYPNLHSRLQTRIDHELGRVFALGYSNHFLIAHDFCHWARSQRILFSGRGSVVDSVLAYCLGFSRIDAFRHNLLFDRFLPDDGSKRPDIDIDFEAHRRDDVRNYITERFGRDRVATVAAIGAFNARGIVREVGKALGLPPETISFLSKRMHGGISAANLESAMERRPELQQSGIPRERFQWVFRLGQALTDVPRNMRAHSSGVVISSRPIAETVPVMWSASEQDDGHLRIIQWDKRSAKYYFDKFDVLCLRGQDVLSGSQERIAVRDPAMDVQKIPIDDEDTYRAMRSGELIGIPQSASPAMRQAHVRIGTANLEDASLVQAGIRPGVGGAVKLNELIQRRRGKPYAYEHPELEAILGHTYGLVVFQEQIDQLLQTFCRYGAGEAEDIRESIHKKRREEYGTAIRAELIQRMIQNGFSQAVAEHVFELVAGFKGYGFAQGHALAFAEISIRSIYLQQNYPAEYFAALLSAQPAGYYGPCTLANEARARGVRILPVCVNQSDDLFQVEDVVAESDPKLIIPNGGIRTALAQVKNLSKGVREGLLAERNQGRFADLFAFVRRVRPSRDELENLILCGALDQLHRNRRAMLWAIPEAMAQAEGPARLAVASVIVEDGVKDFNTVERAMRERELLGMDVAHHLMQFERERVSRKGAMTTEEVRRLPPNQKAIVVGNPIRLRFPPTPSGKRVVFFDLEDETGLLNVTCFDAVYSRDGHAMVCSPYVTIIGRTQNRDGFSAFLAQRVFAYEPKATKESLAGSDIQIPTADFLVG